MILSNSLFAVMKTTGSVTETSESFILFRELFNDISDWPRPWPIRSLKLQYTFFVHSCRDSFPNLARTYHCSTFQLTIKTISSNQESYQSAGHRTSAISHQLIRNIRDCRSVMFWVSFCFLGCRNLYIDFNSRWSHTPYKVESLLQSTLKSTALWRPL